MSKTTEYTHMVFGTRGRELTIFGEHRRDLLNYMFYLLKELGCYVYRINAMPDHVHLFFDKNKKMLVEDIARIVKSKSSAWMKSSGFFPCFQGWCREYYSSSISPWDRDKIIGYVANQEQHHSEMKFVDEMKRLYKASGQAWDDRDMM